MKRILIPLFFFFLTPAMSPAAARADTFPWRGAESWLDGSFGLWKPTKKVELQVSSRYLGNVAAGEHEIDAAVGVKLTLPRDMQLSFRVGAAQWWVPGNDGAEFLIGFTSRNSFFHDRLRFIDDGEFFIGKGGRFRYHGLDDIDLAFVELLTTDDAAYVAKHLDEVLDMTRDQAADAFHPLFLTIGAQCEERDTLIACGPHLGARRARGSWNAELQYMLGFQDGNRGHSLRLLVSFGL